MATNSVTVEGTQSRYFSQFIAVENVGLDTDEQSRNNVEDHHPVVTSNGLYISQDKVNSIIQ